MGALASEEVNLQATLRELPEVLEAARPALDNLNRAFPSTRAWALEMIPGVRETPATIDAGFPWLRQTRALSRPPSCRAWSTTSSRRSTTSRSSSTARSTCCRSSTTSTAASTDGCCPAARP